MFSVLFKLLINCMAMYAGAEITIFPILTRSRQQGFKLDWGVNQNELVFYKSKLGLACIEKSIQENMLRVLTWSLGTNYSVRNCSTTEGYINDGQVDGKSCCIYYVKFKKKQFRLVNINKITQCSICFHRQPKGELHPNQN